MMPINKVYLVIKLIVGQNWYSMVATGPSISTINNPASTL